FGPKEAVARARCVVAEAEIALVSRDLNWPTKALDAARATLEAHGDRMNAAHARYLAVRRLLLIGRLDEAERRLAELDPTPFPPREPLTSWSLPASQCDVCAPKRRALRWRGRNTLRAWQVSLGSLRRSKARRSF